MSHPDIASTEGKAVPDPAVEQTAQPQKIPQMSGQGTQKAVPQPHTAADGQRRQKEPEGVHGGGHFHERLQKPLFSLGSS